MRDGYECHNNKGIPSPEQIIIHLDMNLGDIILVGKRVSLCALNSFTMLILSDEFLPAFFVLFSDMVEQAFIEVRL
jgi:hypothetical protein